MIDQLQKVQVSWALLVLALVTAVAALFLRRLIPESERRRGRWPALLLVLSFLLRVIGAGLEYYSRHSGAWALNLASAIFMAMGLSGVGGTVLFEVILARMGVRVPHLLRDVLVAITFVVAILLILRKGGANVTGLITTSAVLTAVIGLALQEPIGNVAAGLSLQMDRTLSVGNWIRFDERIGKIEKISFRSTLLSTRDGDTITVPNRFFMQHEVVNYSRPTLRHRMWVDVSLQYNHPPNDAKRTLEAALENCPGVLRQPAPAAIVTGFGESGVQYAVLYWVEDFARVEFIESEVRTRIWYALRRAGLEIPYPTRILHMQQQSAEAEKQASERDVQDRRSALAENPLFKPLDGPALEYLARGMQRGTYAAGEPIIRQGDEGDSLFLISEGEVSVHLAVDGVSRQVATLSAGQIFGEASLMTGEPRGATCIAEVDTICHTIDHALFQKLLAQNPALAEDISEILSERQLKLDTEREDLSEEAASRRQAEARRRTLDAVRRFFHLV